jgi:predicted HTH transcriptional regulator
VNNYYQKKPWKEMLSEFLSEPTRPNLRRLLQLEAIEDNDLDFKEELMSPTTLAKHIIAMANKQGGVIIFGLKETEPNSFEPVGIEIENKIDPTDLEKQLSNYLPPELMKLKNIVPTTYTESEYEKLKSKTFISIIVDYDPKYIPFMPLKDGDKIKRNTIYIRKNRATEPANYDDIQDILNRRVETEYSSSSERKLREHLEELKELYTHISKTIGSGYFKRDLQQQLRKTFINLKRLNIDLPDSEDDYVPPKPNPNYPEEDYEQFVARMIKLKKNIIEDVIKK